MIQDFFEIATNFALTPPVLVLFDVAHFILACIEVRNDSLGPSLTRKHPLACLVSCLLVCFAGGFIANFLLGLPIIGELENNFNVLLVIACWYLIFYSPFDMFYRFCNMTVFKLPIVAFKELGRARKISKGIALAASIYPKSLLIMLIIGTIKGSGSGFIRTLDKIIRGVWNPQANELLFPSLATKITFVSAVVLIGGKSEYLSMPYPQLVFVVSLFMVYAKIAVMLLKLNDPLAPLENIGCRILFGKVEDKSVGGDDSQSNPANPGVLSRASTMQSGQSRPKAE